MEPLNYCRQMTKQFLAQSQIPSIKDEWRQDKLSMVSISAGAMKFIMPTGGLLFEDTELKGLDSNGTLMLPYKTVALEIPLINGKAILFAVDNDELISVRCVVFDPSGVWAAGGWSLINKSGSLLPNAGRHPRGFEFSTKSDRNEAETGMQVGVLLSFLSALECSNVHVERQEPRKTRRVKAALQFDTYHVLTVDAATSQDGNFGSGGGPHRSPREHLRRGHIRRCESGKKVWINATVVNAGIGGKVSKDYRLRTGAGAPT